MMAGVGGVEGQRSNSTCSVMNANEVIGGSVFQEKAAARAGERAGLVWGGGRSEKHYVHAGDNQLCVFQHRRKT